MVYIFETEISNKKTITYSLQKIFGLGNKTSHKICKKLGFSNNLKVNDLSKEQTFLLIKSIEQSSILINNDLKKKNYTLLKTLIEIKSYKGLRRLSNLPVRGQRTHTNARTVKRLKKL
uniref:Ribosomal protein S13 n=1 Tax=Eucampia zodiacus TaxID=444606 RepID=A0A7T0CRA9_9STRA|nr:ribosomal protein S13 [Eucampia zodiacus]QPJ79928.1 ribosomal protein S13 [Eucampia zodiacus]